MAAGNLSEIFAALQWRIKMEKEGRKYPFRMHSWLWVSWPDLLVSIIFWCSVCFCLKYLGIQAQSDVASVLLLKVIWSPWIHYGDLGHPSTSTSVTPATKKALLKAGSEQLRPWEEEKQLISRTSFKIEQLAYRDVDIDWAGHSCAGF